MIARPVDTELSVLACIVRHVYDHDFVGRTNAEFLAVLRAIAIDRLGTRTRPSPVAHYLDALQRFTFRFFSAIVARLPEAKKEPALDLLRKIHDSHANHTAVALPATELSDEAFDALARKTIIVAKADAAAIVDAILTSARNAPEGQS